MTPHPYAHALHAIADGKLVQCQSYDGTWRDEPCPEQALARIPRKSHPPERFRVKPSEITSTKA